ncbi:flagellar biosynthetic protein FliO [Alkalihalobacillus hemicellulosilyticus]|uniref:Flagellar biosynthesis protein FliZ n=1 Tax=Halalkalibacter hemicellulosilyticusJCM 9152 TaxID=1236971 RepID=W4QC39_9BACI|nr:flagellar biosynthetic protein FliO [Halalkalibacter hemicellulosilyticus]GAE29258.1 flagellar biosynthesis protein FliZ [Halalkalibacter hemicellulosilyticusJCM 9152]
MLFKARWVGVIVLIIWGMMPLSVFAENQVSSDECSVTQFINGECQELDEPSPSAEEPEAGQVDETIFPETNTFAMFAQTILALAFVIILLYVLLRFVGKRSQSFRSTQILQSMGGVPLGGNRSVQIVRVNDRILVVGVGESIQLLKEITDPEEVNKMMSQQQQTMESFDQPIDKVMSWFRKDKGSLEANSTNHDAFKQLLTKQLGEVSKAQKKVHDEVRERDHK